MAKNKIQTQNVVEETWDAKDTPVTVEYLAFSDEIPKEGERIILSKEVNQLWEEIMTTPIQQVTKIGHTMYKVCTEFSTYFLQVHN